MSSFSNFDEVLERLTCSSSAGGVWTFVRKLSMFKFPLIVLTFPDLHLYCSFLGCRPLKSTHQHIQSYTGDTVFHARGISSGATQRFLPRVPHNISVLSCSRTDGSDLPVSGWPTLPPVPQPQTLWWICLIRGQEWTLNVSFYTNIHAERLKS